MLRKRSISIEGHGTSVALEPEFWAELELLAAQSGSSLAGLVAMVDEARGNANLASALRLHVLASIKAGSKAEPRLPE
jgi:predicted DNA-binding ribbon-helix-helix protein